MRPYPDLRGRRGRGGPMGMGPPPPPPPMHLRGPFPPRYAPNSYADRTEGSLCQELSPWVLLCVCCRRRNYTSFLQNLCFALCDFRYFRSSAPSELDVTHSAELYRYRDFPLTENVYVSVGMDPLHPLPQVILVSEGVPLTPAAVACRSPDHHATSIPGEQEGKSCLNLNSVPKL